MKSRSMFVAVVAVVSALDAATIDEVIVRQQWPWSTDVKVEYRITGVDSPKNIQVAAYDGDTQLDSARLASSMKGDLFGIAKDNYYSFTIDPVKAFGRNDIAVMNFNVRLSVTDSEENMTNVLYKIVNLDSGDVTDVTRGDFYGGKYGSFTTNFSDFVINGTACKTDLDDVLIWTEVTNNPIYKTDFLVLRHIPASSWGVWMMDAPGGDTGISDPAEMAGTPHPVQLTEDYYIGVFPVTQTQYKKLRGTYGGYYTNEATYADHKWKPATGISWNIGMSCAETLSGMTGNRLDFGYPTEAQWEFAARGGVTNKSLFSSAASWGRTTLRHIAWSRLNRIVNDDEPHTGYTNVQTVAVGRLSPNAFGLYDILGNVLEFCSDYSSDAPYSWPEDPEEVVFNPKGVALENAAKTEGGAVKHIQRGGSIYTDHTQCSLRSRFSAGKTTADKDHGFRLFCTVGQE